MTIAIAYTPTASASAAFEAGLAHAKLGGTDLVVINATRGDALVDAKHAGDDDIADLQRQADTAGVEVRFERPMARDLVDAILDVVEKSAGTMLIVGIRHRSPVGKMLLGSTAQRLILDAKVPVLSVKST